MQFSKHSNNEGSTRWFASPVARELARLWSDQEGAVLVLVVIVFLGLSVFAFGVAATGDSLRQKIEMQNAVDAAAYSGAVVQADIFSSCAQLNQAIAWYYGQLLSATAEYITAKWLMEVRTWAEHDYLAAQEGATDLWCECHWDWNLTLPFERGTKRYERVDFETFMEETELAEERKDDAELRIGLYREAVAELCTVEGQLRENAADMIRAEVHDVLRKNVDMPSAQWVGLEQQCFFACDLDTGEEDANWFEPIQPSPSLDPMWKHVTGERYGESFVPDEVLWALGLETSDGALNPDYWLRTRMEGFPGRYNENDAFEQEDEEKDKWYLRARIWAEYEPATAWIDENGVRRCDCGPVEYVVGEPEPRQVKASHVWDDYFDLKNYFTGDKEFTWYRRPREYFQYGTVNVGLARKMSHFLQKKGGAGASMFRVFDPGFWLQEGEQRYMVTVASARAGYRDGDAGDYNPTIDSATWEPTQDEENMWPRYGWTSRSANGFTADWDAVLMPVSRGRSWRAADIEPMVADGEWDDDKLGTGHEVLQRLYEGKWYATAADVSLYRSRLVPVHEGLPNIPGAVPDFPAPVGWSEDSLQALPALNSAGIPRSLEEWPGEHDRHAFDFTGKEQIHELLQH